MKLKRRNRAERSEGLSLRLRDASECMSAVQDVTTLLPRPAEICCMAGLLRTSGVGAFRARRHAHPDRPIAGWAIADRRIGILFVCLVVPACLLALVVYAQILAGTLAHQPHFAELRSLCAGWPEFLHTVSPAALIYDPHILLAFERRVIDAHAHYEPFAYPPSLMLLILPLALLPPAFALFLWSVASLTVYVWACWHHRLGPPTALICVVAPSTLAVLFYAQLSLLVSAAIIAGFRLINRRPLLAGILFGLATVKPQLGILVPVALISARQWRGVASAVATTALAGIASGMAFGWATWARFPAALIAVSAYVARHPELEHLSPTVTASLRMLGATPAVINLAQLPAPVGSIIAIWFCFRRGVTPLSTALLLVATFFVAPYAFFYDLALTTYAVLAVVDERYRSGEVLENREVLILLLVLALPALMFFGSPRIPWGVFILTPFVWLILRRIATTERRTAPRVA